MGGIHHTVTLIAAPRTCIICRQDKTVADFYPSAVHKSGLDPRCKVCERERSRQRNLSIYGLTEATFDTLLAAQGGVCAICGTVPRGRYRFDIDHDHDTGRVRGALCRRCNLILGHVGDDPGLLHAAAEYLGRHTLP